MEVEMEDDNSSDHTDTPVEHTFTAVEVDLDYEFEAARFFDFTREESIYEAREAEMWFDSVESYPPSPLAVRLLSGEQSENVNVPLQSKGFYNTDQLDCGSDVIRASESSDGDATIGALLALKSYYLQEIQKQEIQKQQPTGTVLRGLAFKDSTRNDNHKTTKSSLKPTFPRSSTLMKPTASQLARQNQERLMDNFRFQKSGNSSSGVESQAAKRQKLEGGHLCKANNTKQQPNLIHKAPKTEGENAGHGRLQITVPRPPDLATAQRAQRIRQKRDGVGEHVASRVRGFRALPLNRKIFEAPTLLHQKTTPQMPEFHEFHLKTTERAIQNTAAGPSTSTRCNDSKVLQKPRFAASAVSGNREPKRPQVAGGGKQEDCETSRRFKALPLNKKILSSKGDLGVFRSKKRETTVAVAFNFQTEKRAQHAPPVDLFNKLSLTSELQQDSSSQLSRARPQHHSIFMKGSKENRICSFQQQSKMKHTPTEKLPSSGPKQAQNDKAISEGAPLLPVNRNTDAQRYLWKDQNQEKQIHWFTKRR